MNWGHPYRGKVWLLAGDLLLAAAVPIFANRIFANQIDPAIHAVSARLAGEVLLFMLVFPACFYIFDLYEVRALGGARIFTRLLAAMVLGACTLSFLLLFLQWPWFNREGMAISFALIFCGSFSARRLYKYNWNKFHTRRGVLLIGSGKDAACLQSVMESRSCPYEFLGLLRSDEAAESVAPVLVSSIVEPLFAMAATASGSYRVEGVTTVAAAVADSPAKLSAKHSAALAFGFTDFGVATRLKLERLILNPAVDTIAIRPDSSTAELAEILTRLRFQGVRISTLPDLYSQLLEKLPLETLSDTWLSFASGFNLLHARIFRKIKRLMDILLACAGLIVTLPISFLAVLAIKLESPGPALFKQWRVGWREKPFLLIKFRSMRMDAESDGIPQWATTQDPRVTFVGRILRKLHIDEIPQMINVLLGQMSFVGPRPERPVFVEQFKIHVPFYHLRHYLPPGITGWAQVNYPYGDCMEDARNKLQYDLYYVRNASLTLDLRILLRTARVILFRTGSR